MQMGQQQVQQQQKHAAQHESATHRQKHAAARFLRRLHGGDQQRPYRGSDHHACREAQKYLLGDGGHLSFEEKHHGGTQYRGKTRTAGADGGIEQLLLQHESLLFNVLLIVSYPFCGDSVNWQETTVFWPPAKMESGYRTVLKNKKGEWQCHSPFFACLIKNPHYPRSGDAAPRPGCWRCRSGTSPSARSPGRSPRGGRCRSAAGRSTTSSPPASCPAP